MDNRSLSVLAKYTSLEKPVKATLWFTICNFLVKGIAFIAVPVFAFLMSADEYGLSALFMSYQEILLIAATWELYIGAYQRGIFKFNNEVGGFTFSTILFMNLLTICCVVAFLLFREFFVSITKMPIEIWLTFFSYYFFFPAYNCWMVRKRKEYNYKPVVAATIAYSLISAIAPALALIFIAPTAVVKITAALLPAALFCAVFYVKSIKLRHIKEAFGKIKAQWHYLIRYQSPLILHSLAFYVLNQADIIMISYLVGDAETAYYSVAYSLAMAISLLQNSVNQSLIPWRYEMLEKHNYERIKTSTTSLLVLIGIAILAFIMVAPDVINLFFDSSYELAIWCIPPVSLSAYFIFLYSIFVNVETYYETTQYVMIVSATCALLNIVLNFVGIHFFGFVGCAYATLLSYIAFAIGHYLFMKLTLKKKDVQYDLIDGRSVLLISLGFIGAMVAAVFVYLYTPVRYVVLMVLLMIAVIKRDKIRQVLGGIKDIRQ